MHNLGPLRPHISPAINLIVIFTDGNSTKQVFRDYHSALVEGRRAFESDAVKQVYLQDRNGEMADFDPTPLNLTERNELEHLRTQLTRLNSLHHSYHNESVSNRMGLKVWRAAAIFFALMNVCQVIAFVLTR